MGPSGPLDKWGLDKLVGITEKGEGFKAGAAIHRAKSQGRESPGLCR